MPPEPTLVRTAPPAGTGTPPPTGRAGRLLRYGTVVVVGAGVDLAVALALARVVGLPLTLAAACGFATALCANYLLFEFWAFRRGRSRFSPHRFLRTVLAAGLALAVRLVVIHFLGGAFGGDALGDAFVLLCGMGASLAANYRLVTSIFGRR